MSTPLKTLTDDELRLRLATQLPSQIAEDFGVSRQRIEQRMRAANISNPRTRSESLFLSHMGKVSEEERTRAVHMANSLGFSTASRITGFSRYQLKRWGATPLRRFWTHERIVTAIQDWVQEFGEVPSAQEWNVAYLRNHGHKDALERFYEGRWPHASTVVSRFGRWNDAIRTAGFEPRSPGQRRFS